MPYQSGMDTNFHVAADKSGVSTIFGGQILPEFKESFSSIFGKRGQAYSIISSAVMAYNFFHWVGKNKHIDLEELGEYDEVAFEFPLRTLTNRRSSAKMDVVLINRSARKVLFIESKFTEHFKNQKFSIPYAYKCSNNYFQNGHGDEWVKIIEETEKESGGKKGYFEGIKQEICHLIGICALCTDQYRCRNKRRGIISDICDFNWKFRNIVFKPNPDFVCGESPFKSYSEVYESLKEKVNKISGMDIGIMDYQPIWKAICKAFPSPDGDNYRKFIETRYMAFHQGYVADDG